MLARASVLAFALAVAPTAMSGVVVVGGAAGRAAAQCQQYGAGCLPPASGSLSCGTLPQIGTTLLLCARPTCSTNSQWVLVGSCSPSLPIPSSLTCFGCPRCSLDVTPAVALPWNGIGCYGLSIPRNTSLIGARFCVQNACLFTQPCVCLMHALQVRVIR